MAYKFQCESKDYSEWKVLYSKDLTLVFDKNGIKNEKSEKEDERFNNFDPVSLKLLNGDRFELGEDNSIEITYSIIADCD